MYKKTLALLCVLCISAYADVAQSQEYKDGLKAFNENNYKDALEIFNKLYQKDSSNVQVNFHLGRIYYETGLYEKAMSAFDRVLIMDEDSARTKLELGRTYIALNMIKDAKRVFGEVIDSDAPQAVKDNAQKVLQALEELDSRSKTNYLVSVGVGYDDNVKSASPSDEYLSAMSYITGLNASGFTKPTKIKSMFGQEMFNVRNSYDVGSRNDWFLDSNVLVLNQNHNYINNDTYNGSDLLFGSVSLAPTYMTKEYKLSLPLVYDHVFFGYDQLIHSVYVQPKLDIPLDKTTLLNSYLKYQKKMYFLSTNKNKNAKVSEAGIGLTKTIQKDNITAGYNISREDRVIESTTKNVEKLTHTFSLGYGYNINETFDARASVSYKLTDYPDSPTTPTTGSKYDDREDKSYIYSLSLSQKIDKELSMNYSYTYTDSISNDISTLYNKNLSTIMLNYMF